MTKKMISKAAPLNPTSLDAFIGGADPVTSPEKRPSEAVKAPKAPSTPKKTKERVRRPGKPPMAAEEVRNETVQVKLTEKELKSLKEQAKGVPLSSYLRDRLKDNGII